MVQCSQGSVAGFLHTLVAKPKINEETEET